jgi:hypothetical protein
VCLGWRVGSASVSSVGKAVPLRGLTVPSPPALGAALWHLATTISIAVRLRQNILIVRLKPKSIAEVREHPADRGRFSLLKRVLGIDSFGSVTHIGGGVSRGKAKRSFDLGRPDQILPFDVPGRDDP